MAPSSSSHGKGFSSKRLYIGNLSPSVDEYALMQLFSKFGKIHKLDYLFHKSGPLKGKPRGYAFIEFETKDEALKAMVALDDKLVRGKKISVTSASEQPVYEDQGGAGKGRGASRSNELNRPTAISLLKGQGVNGVSTNRKIAALEAKLAALRKEKPVGSTSSSKESTPEPSASTSNGQKVDGEAWLDAMASEANGTEQTETAEQASGAAPTSGSSLSRIDPIKAGLPSRPAV